MGFGMTREMVGAIVVDYLTTIGKDNPFIGQPSFKWQQGFHKRFPQPVDPKAQPLLKHRASTGTYSLIQGFLAKVSELLQLLRTTDAPDLGDRLWNCHKSGVCTSVVSSTVLARRGAKWVHEITGGSGQEITTVHSGSA